MRGTAAVEPIDNRLFVLVLQHPQEKREELATAAATCAALRRAALVVGLSWPNLARALGRPADAREWAALYLGSARPAAFGLEREIVALDRAGRPSADQNAMLRGLEGVVLLDGSWSEAKTLWWRNPWFLRLRRLVLNPPHRSRFGRVRREPRREALSTLDVSSGYAAMAPGGKVKFGPDGKNIYGHPVGVQWQNGDLASVFPKEDARAPLMKL